MPRRLHEIPEGEVHAAEVHLELVAVLRRDAVPSGALEGLEGRLQVTGHIQRDAQLEACAAEERRVRRLVDDPPEALPRAPEELGPLGRALVRLAGHTDVGHRAPVRRLEEEPAAPREAVLVVLQRFGGLVGGPEAEVRPRKKYRRLVPALEVFLGDEAFERLHGEEIHALLE